jgi:predicted outer membrane repeat protein
MFPMHIRTAWNDYFIVTNYNSTTYTSGQTLSGTSVLVSNCLFKSCTSTNHGGAIFCTSVSYLLIESTSFFSCRTSAQYGGAIFFQNSGSGQCVLHEVCGYDCYSTYTSSSAWSQFARVEVNNAASIKNYVNYSSISRCVNEGSDSLYTLGLKSGKICCPSVNMSMNKCQWYSVIGCWPLQDSNFVTCSFTHSSFTDNIANGHTCIWLNTHYAEYEIKSCNILRNTEVSSRYGIIYTSGNLKIEDSCILENTGTYIFYQYYSSYTITLSNCTVDKTSNNQKLTIQNTVEKSFILALNHMSTQNCHSEYDSAGTLTPIIQTPSPSKKPLRLCTCGKCFYQPQLTDFFSLHNIFIFKFIHLDASYNLW